MPASPTTILDGIETRLMRNDEGKPVQGARWMRVADIPPSIHSMAIASVESRLMRDQYGREISSEWWVRRDDIAALLLRGRR